MHGIVGDAERYRAMTVAARQQFENNLNWPAWAQAITTLFESVRR
jgi:hypothetical protein